MATYNLPSYKSAPKYSAGYQDLPTYSAPSWNQSEVDTNTQKNAATGLRALRQTVSKISGANYESSGAKRMTLRDALAGYGSGIGSTMTAAGTTALNDYTQKFSATSKNAEAEYGAKAAAATAKNAWSSDTAAQNFKGEMTQWSAENAGADAKAAAEYGSASDAEAAATKYGYDSEQAKTAAKVASDAATKQDEYRTAAAVTAADTASKAIATLHGFDVETAATAAKTAAETAATKFGNDSKEAAQAADVAAMVAARQDEYKTAAAETENLYSIAATKAAAATAAAAAAQGNEYGKEASAEAARVAAEASKTALDASWALYKKKYLWDEEQAQIKDYAAAHTTKR